MSLPSQTARSSPAGRPYVYRRRRRSKAPWPALAAIGLVALLVVAGAWYLIFGPAFSGPEQATAAEANLTDPLITEPLPPDSGAPLVIEQGGARDENPTGRPDPEPTPPAESVTVGEAKPTPPPLSRERGLLGEALSGDAPETTPVSRPDPDRPSPATNGSPRKTQLHLDAADELLDRNDPLAARQALWDAMKTPNLDEVERSLLRSRIAELNAELLFSPRYVSGDPLCMLYEVQPGDALSRIVRSRDLDVHWKFIQRINGLSSPNTIRVGQKLKLVRGTFHALVDKSDFRLDLFHGDPEAAESWVYIRSFEVGLGEGDSTPVGHFIVREDSKLENPSWVNPRNPSEKYTGGDPDNPIGEHWVGLDGLGDAAAYAGYGLHGTIEPESIGREMSMGCVRMRPDDIALIYELLAEGESLVRIRR